MNDKVMCYKLIPPKRLSSGFIIETEGFDMNVWLDGCEAGDIWTVEVVEMSEDELEKLPEFEGF